MVQFSPTAFYAVSCRKVNKNKYSNVHQGRLRFVNEFSHTVVDWSSSWHPDPFAIAGEIDPMVANFHTNSPLTNSWPNRRKNPKILDVRRKLTLRSALAGFVLLGIIIAAFSVLTFVREQHRLYENSAMERAVNVRLNGIETAFGRSLNTNWKQLDYLAKHILDMTPEMRRVALDVIVGDGERVAWVGFSTSDGLILTASKGMLEGQSMAERLWFQQGFRQNYAGDVHEDVMLSKILNSSATSPMRFIDLSRPIIDPEGNTVGVLGMQIQFDWLVQYLSESAFSLGIHAYLVNEAGEVVLATDGVQYDRLDLQSIRTATAGFSKSQLEVWPDNQTYFTSVLPKVMYDDLPSFGWRIVGRLNPSEFALAETNLIRNGMKLIGALSLILLVLTALFSRVFITPIEKLAESAMRNVDGADEYPFEAHQTAELSKLSTALAVLQGRQDEKPFSAETVRRDT